MRFGSIGNVNSHPNDKDTGKTGTMLAPRTTQFSNTSVLLRLGAVKLKQKKLAITHKQITLSATMKALYLAMIPEIIKQTNKPVRVKIIATIAMKPGV